jgi:hypothetical protein
MAFIGVLTTQIWYRTFIVQARAHRPAKLPPVTVSIDRRSNQAKRA